eukprot:9107335-Prorocentrum_lima.AAC.1
MSSWQGCLLFVPVVLPMFLNLHVGQGFVRGGWATGLCWLSPIIYIKLVPVIGANCASWGQVRAL